MPAALNVDWKEIKYAAAAGCSYQVLAGRFGVKTETIKKRAQREMWAVPGRFGAERNGPVVGVSPMSQREVSREVSRHVAGTPDVPVGTLAAPPTAQEVVMDVWKSRIEESREDWQTIGKRLRAHALKESEVDPDGTLRLAEKLKTVQDIERKNYGLDKDQGPTVNLAIGCLSDVMDDGFDPESGSDQVVDAEFSEVAE